MPLVQRRQVLLPVPFDPGPYQRGEDRDDGGGRALGLQVGGVPAGALGDDLGDGALAALLFGDVAGPAGRVGAQATTGQGVVPLNQTG